MRCIECDSRYCPQTHCAAGEDKAYVVGTGYVSVERAWVLAQQGARVDWPQSPAWEVLRSLGRSAWMPVRDMSR